MPETACQQKVETAGTVTDKYAVPADAVSYYEIGFPDVLRPPAHRNGKIFEDMTASLYGYAICWSVLQEGLNPIKNLPVTQFILLNHFPLPQEIVTHFNVRLNLPHQECVSAFFSPAGVVHLSADQVEAAKLFNGILFNLVCGRSTFDNGFAENQIKGYLLLPLKDKLNAGMESKGMTFAIDWTVTLNLVHWKVGKRERSFDQGRPSLITQALPHDDSAANVKGRLRLKCGIYEEVDLIDSFVTYSPWDANCIIMGIAKELSALSMMQGEHFDRSYKDYWWERFKVELQHVSQPLLLGHSLVRTCNFLQRPSQEALWCNARMKRVILPAEVCMVNTVLKGKLWRGAFRLPSILHGLESALLASQLKDSIGIRVSSFKLQEALKSGACNEYQSYEYLELVGDSYLTLIGAAVLFIDDCSMSKEDLGNSLYKLVRNKSLFQYAKMSGLASYVFNESFQIKQWTPPGVVCERPHPMENKAQSACLHMQRISWRTLADVVEAIVGACVMFGETADAVKAMLWLGIPIQYPKRAVSSFPSGIDGDQKGLIPESQIINLERLLKYRFQSHDCVVAAICISSRDSDGGLQFSRLSFLGDCILSYHVARHLVTAHELMDVGMINEMKQTVINKESLACTAVRSGLYCFIIGIHTAEKESIMKYASMLEEEKRYGKPFPAFGLLGVSAPRGLGDLVSAIAAAIFLDCNLDTEQFWKVMWPLLEPLPEPGSFSVHPIKALTQFCKIRHFSLNIDVTGEYDANVIVNNKSIARAVHEEKRLARKFAAVQALCELELQEQCNHV